MTIQAAIVREAHYWLGGGPMRYGQVRPVPLGAIKAHKPNTTDCSGSITGIFYTAGAPDPNGGDYSRTELMYTGTLIHAGASIPIAKLMPADLVIYSVGGTTVHAALVIDAGLDPLLFSHGGPDGAAPHDIRLSAESAWHRANGGATPVGIRPNLSAQTIVIPKTTITAGDGTVLARTRYPILWQRKHPRWAGHKQITLRR